MGVLKFEELEAFKRAYVISLEIHKASLGFPGIEQHGLADQIRRASKSISREHRGGICQIASIQSRAQALFADGAGIGR